MRSHFLFNLAIRQFRLYYALQTFLAFGFLIPPSITVPYSNIHRPCSFRIVFDFLIYTSHPHCLLFSIPSTFLKYSNPLTLFSPLHSTSTSHLHGFAALPWLIPLVTFSWVETPLFAIHPSRACEPQGLSKTSTLQQPHTHYLVLHMLSGFHVTPHLSLFCSLCLFFLQSRS